MLCERCLHTTLPTASPSPQAAELWAQGETQRRPSQSPIRLTLPRPTTPCIEPRPPHLHSYGDPHQYTQSPNICLERYPPKNTLETWNLEEVQKHSDPCCPLQGWEGPGGCEKALVVSARCGLCAGASLKPCAGACASALSPCLAQLALLQPEWDKFTGISTFHIQGSIVTLQKMTVGLLGFQHQFDARLPFEKHHSDLH